MKYLYFPDTLAYAGTAGDEITVPYWLPVAPPQNNDLTKVVVADPANGQWIIVSLTPEQLAAQLAMQKTVALQRVDDFARATRAEIAGTSDAGEMAGWANKLRIALAIQAGSASDADKAAFQAEIDARGRGETLDAFVQKVVVNAAFFSRAVALIDGLKSKAQGAINAATSVDQVQTVLTTVKSEADAAFAELMKGASGA